MAELEHAIKHIKTRADAWAVKEVTEALQNISERLDKALSQEPCDAISREKVLEMITDFATLELYIDKHNHVTFEPLEKLIKSLPSVTQKSGRWIDHSDEGYVECPFCDHATNCEDNIDELHYCFYCGARMVEPQESEDK